MVREPKKERGQASVPSVTDSCYMQRSPKTALVLEIPVQDSSVETGMTLGLKSLAAMGWRVAWTEVQGEMHLGHGGSGSRR